MPLPNRQAPSPLLLDPDFWRQRLAAMDGVRTGLLILPRTDLSDPAAEVVEWRLRAHDGLRVWGLRGQSPFHPAPKGASVRSVESTELAEVDHEQIASGCIDFIYQVPPGRKLEDRVLDLLRVVQVVTAYCDLDPEQVQLPSESDEEPDEYMIARLLLRRGIC